MYIAHEIWKFTFFLTALVLARDRAALAYDKLAAVDR